MDTKLVTVDQHPGALSLLDDCNAIECTGYPADEGASRESLAYRMEHASPFFLLAIDQLTDPSDRFMNEGLCGYICGTATKSEELHHDTMTAHDPHGRVLCIHSVATRLDLRGKGLARLMLTQYIKHVQVSCKQIEAIVLVAKAYLVRFYESCGFFLVGKSSLVHGADTWYEMKLYVNRSIVSCADAFTVNGAPFTGNQAAVVWEQPPRSIQPDSAILDRWMQNTAAELNLAETSFVRPLGDMDPFPKPSPTLFDNPVTKLLHAIHNGETPTFADIISVIDETFNFHPTNFVVGDQSNDAGSNHGSCKVLAFASALNFTKDAALRLWGEHYRGVLDDPEGSSHANIRNFMAQGPRSVKFDKFPLEAKVPNYAKVSVEPSVIQKFALRWFTPTTEVDLCGHATLASAFAIWNHPGHTDRVHPTELHFETKSGTLIVSRESNLPEEKLLMIFPQETPAELAQVSDELTETLCDGLAVQADDIVYVGTNRMDMIVELKPDAFQNVTPSSTTIAKIPHRGLLVTATPDSGNSTTVDYVTRFFAPQSGIDEDPATGSAACCSGPYWANKLQKSHLSLKQTSKRGAMIDVEVMDNGKVKLKGSASSAWSGRLHTTPFYAS